MVTDVRNISCYIITSHLVFMNLGGKSYASFVFFLLSFISNSNLSHFKQSGFKTCKCAVIHRITKQLLKNVASFWGFYTCQHNFSTLFSKLLGMCVFYPHRIFNSQAYRVKMNGSLVKMDVISFFEHQGYCYTKAESKLSVEIQAKTEGKLCSFGSCCIRSI